MLVRSLSGLDRNTTGYVMLPPGLPVVASTPCRTPIENRTTIEPSVISAGLLSSFLVFLMWVGAWGFIDTVVGMVTDDSVYQLGMYGAILLVACIGVWLQLEDWKRAQEDIEDDSIKV